MAQGRLLTLKEHLHPTMTSTSSISSAAQAVLNTRQQIPVLDSTISYLDTKDSSPNDRTVLFLHGNPTAAFLWRNVIPHVQTLARCLAPDLIGFGHSGKQPQNQYRFVDQYRYLNAWIEKMQIKTKVNLVIQDWGSALGFHWANEHRDKVESITFFEGMSGVTPNWDAMPEVMRQGFKDLRSPKGEDIVINKNAFIEVLFPSQIMRQLSEDEMEEYLMPFKEGGETRRPMLTFPRDIPIRTDGPKDTTEIVDAYLQWLRTDAMFPKLFIEAKPGLFSAGMKDGLKNHPMPNLKSVTIKGLHFVQEDSPEAIGTAIQYFLVNDVCPKS